MRRAETKEKKEEGVQEEQEPKGEKLQVQEDVRIPNTDIILESGDEVVVYPKAQEEKKKKTEMRGQIEGYVSVLNDILILGWGETEEEALEDGVREYYQQMGTEDGNISERDLDVYPTTIPRYGLLGVGDWTTKNFGDEEVVVSLNESKKVAEKQSLDAIMKKVGKGTELSDSEEKVLKAALDAAKGKDDDNDIVDKIMDKVRKGKELTDREETILNAAKDAEKGKKD